MRFVIYYFTGTGNSLAAAKKDRRITRGDRTRPHRVVREHPGAIAPEAGRIGTVCPVYGFGVPAMVTAFAKRLDTAPAGYLFAVVTHGGGGGAAVCPAGNIDMVDGRPVWNHRCELCCGCTHLCPAGAIQAGSRTEGRQRYRHPDVTVADMERQAGRNRTRRAG